MATKQPSHEEALALVYEYREKDPRVVAMAKAYAMMLTQREITVEKWDRLDELLAALKRTFKP